MEQSRSDDHQCRKRSSRRILLLYTTSLDSGSFYMHTDETKRGMDVVVALLYTDYTTNVICGDWPGCVLKSASDVSVLEVRCSVAS